MSKPYLFWSLGLALSEKQVPQVIVNKQKWKEAREGLELSRELAKQVLSQLSYTPPVATGLNSKASAAVRETRNTAICLIGFEPAIEARSACAFAMKWIRAVITVDYKLHDKENTAN